MELTWGKVVVGGFALTTAVAGGTWALRADRIAELESRVSFYEKAEELTVPNTLKSMDKINSQILENIEKLTDYQALKTSNVELMKSLTEKNKEVDSLTKKTEEIIQSKNQDAEKFDGQLSEMKQNLIQKQQYIDDLLPHNEEFTISERKSKDLFGARMIVGVVDVSNEHVTVSYNNKEKEMPAGTYQEMNIDGNSCKLILQEIHWAQSPEQATFRVACRKI